MNKTGEDERGKRLWHLILKEPKIRLEIHNVFVKLGKKKLYRVTEWPECVYLDIIYVWNWLFGIVDLIELFLREINTCKGEEEKTVIMKLIFESFVLHVLSFT